MNRNKKRKKTKVESRKQRRSGGKPSRRKSPKRGRNLGVGKRRSRKTPRRSPAVRRRKPLQKTSRSPATEQRASALAKLQSDWTSLPRSERCAELKRLVDQGISKRELARRLKCSQTLIRDFVHLAELPEQERLAVEAGTLGRKQALRRVRDRKRMKHLPEPSPADRQRLIEKCAAIVEDFLRQHLREWYWRQCLWQIKAVVRQMRLEELKQGGGKPSHRPLSTNPRKTFWECRPEGKEPSYAPDMINWVVGWVAAWSRRVLPDSEARDAAIDRAERNLNPKEGRGW